MKNHIYLSSLLIAFFLFQSSAMAAPTINWSSKKLNATVMQGTYQLHKIKVKFNQNIETITPVIDPKLHKWITVSPSYIDDIKAGQEKTFTLSIAVPEDESLGKYRGKLRIANVAQDGSRKSIGSPFHIVFSIDKLIIDDTLPPDPGELGKMTIEGIDSDSDGLRDDLQRYIAIKYQSSEKLRIIMTEMAKVNQDFIVNHTDRAQVLSSVEKRNKHFSCLFYIDPEIASQHNHELKRILLNTTTRSRAFIKANAMLSGMTFEAVIDEKSQCNFDPDSLEN